ncbi:MAG: prephenate dehydrogenase/arogenate dehydrogenase family protein [Candidatus Bathyarchaeia archaeon]
MSGLEGLLKILYDPRIPGFHMAKEKITILGGTGGMGRWFARFFSNKGYSVTITGRSFEKAEKIANELGVGFAKANREAASEADIILVATPIETTAGVIRELRGSVRRGAILFDIASVKSSIIEALEEASKLGARTASVHPMFGPGAESMHGQKVIIIPVRGDLTVVHQLTELFEEEGAVVHLLPDGATHDRIMALVLALPHFLNAVFALTVPPETINDIKKMAGTTFTLQLLVAESTLQDLNLSAQLQTSNMAFQGLLVETLKIAKRLGDAVSSGDRVVVKKLLEEAKAHLALDPDFQKAYEKFYAALRAIS